MRTVHVLPEIKKAYCRPTETIPKRSDTWRTCEPCESCGRHLWWWDSVTPAEYPGAFFEHPSEPWLQLGTEHTPERCRWWRGDPSTSWGPPPRGNK